MAKYIETKEEALHRVRMANKADYNKAFAFAQDWVKLQFKVFSANDFKKAYLEKNELPQQVNIFGAVFSNLVREKLIFRRGTVTSNTPEARGCLIRAWISKEYSEQQRDKRELPITKELRESTLKLKL